MEALQSDRLFNLIFHPQIPTNILVLRQSPESLNKLFQQMKSMHSFKIEGINGTGPTPSIAVANNDKTPNELSTV